MTIQRQDDGGDAAETAAAGADFGAFRRRPSGKAAAAEPAVDTAAVPEADPAIPPDDLIEVGAIAQAYGVRGQVKVFPHASVGQGGDALLAAPYWWLHGGRPRTTRRVKVLSARVHSGSIAAALGGSDDRDAAEALRGSTVSVRRADFPKLASGEYYWVDLIGLAVVNPAGIALGHVTDLMDNGAHAVLQVGYPLAGEAGAVADPQTGRQADPAAGDAGLETMGERLIPFVDAYLRDVDLVGRRIVVDWDVDY